MNTNVNPGGMDPSPAWWCLAASEDVPENHIIIDVLGKSIINWIEQHPAEEWIRISHIDPFFARYYITNNLYTLMNLRWTR